jgi:hypothetical protein
MSPPRLKRRVSHEQRRRDFRFLARFRKLLGDHSGVTLERLRGCVRSGNWRRRPVPGMPAQEESINSCISTRLSFQRAAPLAATAIGDVSRMARREPVAGVGAERASRRAPGNGAVYPYALSIGSGCGAALGIGCGGPHSAPSRSHFVYEVFTLEIDQYGASTWTAQALPALRRGAVVFRVVPA